MADRDDVAGPHKDMRFAELEVALLLGHRGGAEHHKQGVAVAFELGPLVGPVGVLDGQVMEAERLLHLAQQGLAGLMEAHPEETVLLLEDRVEVRDLDVGDTLAISIGGTVDDFTHGDLPGASAGKCTGRPLR